MLDGGLLLQAGIQKRVIVPADFASDDRVAELYSTDTIKKVLSIKGVPEDEKNALALTLFFMNCYHMAVYGAGLTRETRVSLVWTSMIWVTTIEGLPEVTKRNFVTTAVALVFLFCRSDISQFSLTTEEPCEHMFGSCRCFEREFTVLGLILRAKDMAAFWEAAFRSSLFTGRGNKGYTSNLPNFVEATKTMLATRSSNFTTPRNIRHDEFHRHQENCRVDIDYSSGVPVVDQIAPSLLPLLSELGSTMANILRGLGVSDGTMSPFSRRFGSTKDLLSVYRMILSLSACSHVEIPDEDPAVVNARETHAFDDLTVRFVFISIILLIVMTNATTWSVGYHLLSR